MTATVPGSIGVTYGGGRRVMTEERFKLLADEFAVAAAARSMLKQAPRPAMSCAPTEEHPVDIQCDTITLKTALQDDTGMIAVFTQGAGVKAVPLKVEQCEDLAFEAQLIMDRDEHARWNAPQLMAGHALAGMLSRQSDPRIVSDAILDFQGGRTVHLERLHQLAFPEQYAR